jgi:hypothetical protein
MLGSSQDAPKVESDTRKKIKHQVVKMTEKADGNPAEVSVSVNPRNPEQLVAVAHVARGCLVCTSQDEGKTWKRDLFPNPMKSRIQGDDLVVFTPEGKLYHACIRFQGIRISRPRVAETGIWVTKSDDGGLTWGAGAAVVDHVNSVEPFEDKPWLAVDTNPESKHKGNVYVAWTRFDVYGSKAPEHKSHVVFSRSTDQGSTFRPLFRISDKPGDCEDSDGTVMGAMPAVGTKGEVNVVWAGPEGICFDRSDDGGVTFGQDVIITKNPEGWDIEVEGVPRHNGLPTISVDTSTGPDRGTIYVTWLDKRNQDCDVFCSSSRDGGKTWGAPVRVNDDGKGKDQLFPWSVVDPVDGSVNVVYYDRRGLDGANTGLTLARSVDGGKTFVNYVIDQKPFECQPGLFFGDYIGLTAHGGRVAAVYSYHEAPRELALGAALFRFKPGTQEAGE